VSRVSKRSKRDAKREVVMLSTEAKVDSLESKTTVMSAEEAPIDPTGPDADIGAALLKPIIKKQQILTLKSLKNLMRRTSSNQPPLTNSKCPLIIFKSMPKQ